MQVKDAMHRGVEWVEPATTVAALSRLMAERNIGAIPIGENDRLVGMVTDRDIVCRALAKGLDPAKATARDVMTKGIHYCTEQADLGEAAQLMERHKVRRLPVLDQNKRMTGMLSVGDIAHTSERRLVGEVLDRAAPRAA